jgi:hypothetical protein
MAVATTLSPSKTALQRHAAFFDPGGTGKVTIGQTWAGLGRLGVSLVWRVLLTPIINGFLGYLTQRRISFEILVDKIADGKHPFDTGTFGDDGRIDEIALAKVLEICGNTSITAKEMRAHILARGNHRPQMGKLAGTLGSWFSGKEVRLFFCIAADTTKTEGGEVVPAVTPRTLHRLYDGTLFPTLARRRRIQLARARR